MIATLRLLWRWGWIVSLPIAAFFVTWLIGMSGLYYDYQLRYNIAPNRMGWRMEGTRHAQHLSRRLQVMLQPGQTPDIPVVNLSMENSQQAALDHNLPHSGFEYVKGELQDEDRSLSVKVRYRGDFFYHWAYAKKSLRVKTKKTKRFFGLRTFNLTAPKFTGQVHDLLGYVLADHLGLMAPKAELVWVNCNGDCRGLHLMLEQIGESTLRDRARMPGDIYSGELVAKDAWVGIQNNVFDHPRLWTKMATNNHFAPEARRPLERLCELLALPASEELHEELGRILDIEAFARLSAMEILIGNFHTGESHNWRLYWDPWRTRFEPIVWDANAYGGFEQMGPTPPVGLDPNVSRVHNLLLTSAKFLAARQRILREFFESGQVDSYLEEVRRSVKAARFAIDHDPLLRPANGDVVRAVVDRLLPHIDRFHRVVVGAYLDDREDVRWTRLPGGGARIEVRDRVPVTAVDLRFSGPVGSSTSARLRVARTGEVVERSLGTRCTGDGPSLRCQVSLHAQLQPAPRIEMGFLKVFSHRVKPTTYDLVVDGLPDGVELLGVHVERSGGTVEAAQPVAELPAPHHDLLYGTVPSELPEAVRWSGAIELDGVTTIEGDLHVEAGTTVRLAPQASLLVRGRCIAEGSVGSPIRFERQDATHAWGAFALAGARAAGSRFAHVTFDGGSGLVDPDGMFEYCGSVSVHDVRDVTFSDCRFQRGSIVDDLVHVVYSDVVFRDCSFREHAGDALDIDISRAELRDCVFEQVANDGLDLMTSRVIAQDCRFDECRDKGISVGEGSQLLALSCVFQRCAIGMQAKDGSRAAVANSDYLSCGQSLDAYLKNWRYAAGGYIYAWSCRFSGSTSLLTADDDSKCRLASVRGALPQWETKRIRLVEELPKLRWLSDLGPQAVPRWLAALAERGR